ncbi:MAG TPA: hypothetical protein VFW65_21630 [Pseudonocardiaceae bacterium]|nr:hypothetical protein [Pseudonocardiaceae bacterium]
MAESDVRVVPANEASWDDLQAVFGRADCGHPDADGTSGLVAYLDGQPVGWVAVEMRLDLD